MQNTHNRRRMRVLHGALLDIVAVMNRPQRDEALMQEAGISLDRALFPLLIGVERAGPIGVVDLAERTGRDYTTVSRQVAKLETLGLVERREGAADKRVREAVVTPQGQALIDSIDGARERMATAILAEWNEEELDDLTRLMRRLADALLEG